MSLAEATESAPDHYASEANEAKIERPGLLVMWDKPDGEKDLPCDPNRVRQAAQLVGIDADAIDQMVVILRDSGPAKSERQTSNQAVVNCNGIDINFDDGSSQYFAYALELNYKDKDGNILPTEALDQLFFHELTHVRQMATGTMDAKNRWFDFNNPKHVAIGTGIGKASVVTGVTAGGASATALATGVGTGTRLMPISQFMELLDMIPHGHTLAAVGMGALSVMTAGIGRLMYKNMKPMIMDLYHKFNAAENEARANEHLAQQYQVFTTPN